MELALHGKRAMVCGSSKGIGRATAIEMAEQGASVTLVARTEETLLEVMEKLPKANGQNHAIMVADFTDTVSLQKALDDTLSKHGPVHILVNNSGGPAPGPVETAKADEFLQAFKQHLITNHILAQNLLPGMKEAGYGRIVNVISTSVKQPIPGLGVSNTIRGAVANWAKTLAEEVGEHGITVNNVLPGATWTERLEEIFETKALRQGTAVDQIMKEEKGNIPAKRFASPDETASAISFLASPAAAYINGINLPVDGGRTRCL